MMKIVKTIHLKELFKMIKLRKLQKEMKMIQLNNKIKITMTKKKKDWRIIIKITMMKMRVKKKRKKIAQTEVKMEINQMIISYRNFKIAKYCRYDQEIV